ncbi:hypothetical protein DL766_010158 [Monosporascus sp. MC13-8B]|uniref:Integral membrane protein n=1 Tax=Monosporascus cannonballus TaxID=155416 RepID=A0ABY0HBJ6_9PEZI|nr:hypothetical protein DL762_003544 [Monosporascus cannonballus]RYO96532.1 hypothetical protein DL763_003151 [Monosporascus cannonballus]RYP09097.1 hypothetical protein DL766_010158 [Monosporascus sp. MC13-8B]
MSQVSAKCRDYPPASYRNPRFPLLYWPPQEKNSAIYSLWDSWRFTTTWTLILYVLFHLSAAAVALFMQIGKKRSTWKYVWAVPVIYVLVGGIEAVFAGSIVGLVLGAIYTSGCYRMSTWIPFVWSWINALVLVVSSFSIQGGL